MPLDTALPPSACHVGIAFKVYSIKFTSFGRLRLTAHKETHNYPRRLPVTCLCQRSRTMGAHSLFTVCRAYCYPSITPLKDMETVIHGSSLTSQSFQAAVHGVLRTLIDQLGVTTFNVGISGMAVASSGLAADTPEHDSTAQTAAMADPHLPVVARCAHLATFRVLETAALLHMPRLSKALVGHLTQTQANKCK